MFWSRSRVVRPPRIEHAGGVFHVVVRGNERSLVFRDDRDRVVRGAGLPRFAYADVRAMDEIRSCNHAFMMLLCKTWHPDCVSLGLDPTVATRARIAPIRTEGAP